VHQPEDAAAQHPDRAAAGDKLKRICAAAAPRADNRNIIGGRAMIHLVPFRHEVQRTRHAPLGLAAAPAAVALAVAAILAQTMPARAQAPTPPTSPTLACPDANPPFVMPPEIVSSGGILRGTLNLTEQFQRVPSTFGGPCAPQLMRVFQGAGLPPSPTAQPPAPDYADPIPAPTLRARVGDLVQLTFVNQVNSNRFDRNIDIDACQRVGQNGSIYPGTFDTFPNCLHASSTANIHFHGTHTSPSSTGDNVYLQVRPLPRDNQGNLTVTPAQATASLDDFFRVCAQQLRNPLNQWPVHWNDIQGPYIDKQIEMLKAYQTQNPTQPLWDEDQTALKAGEWPQYYIGAVPYCFALPQYTANVWPPPPGSNSPNMGQSPGTHWYHAHKHGSTAINVGNGMTGVFIIEGQYDTDLNAFYSRYTLRNGAWNIRAQPVMVLNQLLTVPNRLNGTPGGSPDFAVNGRLRPVLQMQPGEVQLWRIANTSGRSAAYFQAPVGLQWRQIAQDGVQFTNQNYRISHNHPIYVAPGNRIDLLVQAPMQPVTTNVLIQNVMARADVNPTPANPTPTDPNPGTPLLSVVVSGPPVTLNNQPTQMPFINQAPQQPVFLADIADWELRRSHFSGKRLTFDSKGPGSKVQHTINGIQFEDNLATVPVHLGAVEEWTIRNTTSSNGPGLIDHPFHIHINPFQITELFDPNENMTDPRTGQVIGVLVNGKTVPIPQYVVAPAPKTDPRQCVLDPNDPGTWRPCRPPGWPPTGLVWWDVFAIPSGRAAASNTDPKNVIPGYFKMRSRFVDYGGLYVLHCHILIHEDRGMMFSVNVSKPLTTVLKHH
jgi:FtsP/CotA-like multicopper oxidase with cupredoxin domain